MLNVIKNIKKHPWALVVSGLTIFLYQLSFPPFHLPEAVYFFSVPFLLWSIISKSNNPLKTVAFGSAWLAWLILIFWLRHVTWVGMIMLSGILAIFLGGWLLVASNVLSKIQEKSPGTKLLALAGLAGLWVVIEWLKTFLFSGFPWLPLAASQWERPVLLQILSWTGSYGLSFVIIFINLGITQYGLHLHKRIKSGKKPERFSCVEFYAAIAMLVGLIFIFTKHIPKPENQELVFKTGIAQPYTPGLLKWDKALFEQNLLVLEEETMQLKADSPDVILWPETAVPASLNNSWGAQQWAEALAASVEIPLLVGALMDSGDNVYTALVEVTPEGGVSEKFYAKRKLVPFGEYVPMRKWIPFVDKFVPVSFDVLKGQSAEPLNISINERQWKIGGLICYEDVFPQLARESTLLGAELFVMVTNNTWYGEEAGAYQHAAHSVLRAVEMRRPIVRCGNGGWSGWIDEYGNIREVATNEAGSVYFRGVTNFTLYRDRIWNNRLSFYAKHGDWFVWMCLGFSGTLFFTARRRPQ